MNKSNDSSNPPPDRPLYVLSTDSDAEEMSLQDVLRVLLKGRWIVLASVVIGLGVSAWYTHRQPRIYETSATVYLSRPATTPRIDLGTEAENRKMANEIQLVHSRRLAYQVAERLVDMESVPETGRRISLLGDGSQSLLAIAQRVQGHIRAAPVSRDVDFIALTASSTIPEEAALIANVYAGEYVDYNRTVSRASITASREFLSEVSERFNRELEAAENDLISFLVSESVVAPDEEARRLIEQVTTLNQTQYETDFDLGRARTELFALEAEVDRLTSRIENLTNAGATTIINRLQEEIATTAFLVEQKYAHNPGLRENPSSDPELVEMLRSMESMKAELGRRIARLVEDAVAAGGLDLAGGELGADSFTQLNELLERITERKIEISGMEARQQLIADRIAQYQARLQELPNKEMIVNRLERSLATREQLYMTLVTQLQEARIAEQTELGSIQIVDEALTPGSPVSPRTNFHLTLGGILGLLGGIGLAFGYHVLDNRIRGPRDLRERGYSVVATIPDMRRFIKTELEGRSSVEVEGREYDTRLMTHLMPSSPVAEAYRRLRTNVPFLRPDHDVRIVLVTSPAPADGKTVTSMNLAVVMAQSNRRVLFVDADLHRRQSHRLLGHPSRPGLVDLLFGDERLSIDAFKSSIPNLYIVPGGNGVPGAAEVLASDRMRAFLREARKRFDVVVIDAPPVLALSDALLLAPESDAVLMVCSARSSRTTALEQATELLENVGTKQIGFVLNRYRPSRFDDYGYRYYEYYAEQT